MSDTLIAALDAAGTDSASLPHMMRYYVSALSDDLPEAEMRERLELAGIDQEDLRRVVDRLEHDAALLESASLFVLQEGFDAGGHSRELAHGAIGAAGAKLPVVEAGLVAIVAVYGMWLAVTKGRRSQTHVIRRGPDGSLEEIETTDWYGPSGPLQAIAGLFGAEVDGDGRGGLPGPEGGELGPGEHASG